MNEAIRPTAYEPDPEFGTWIENFHVIAFSEDWRSRLTELYLRRHPDRERWSLPVRQLNSLLRAAAPGVVATGRRSGADAEVSWICARSPVPREVVEPLVTSWVLGRYGDEDRVIDVLGSMYREIPNWSEEPISLSDTPLSLAGTAVPARRLYSLVPEVLAARLAAQTYRHAGIDVPVRFRIVDQEQGAELVSWPPFRYRAKNNDWFYSATISIKMHTVPLRPGYRVHVATGIRRWTTAPRVDLAGGRTVLLDVPLPWPSSTGNRTARLIVNQIRYRGDLKRADWARYSVAHLLPDLDIVRSFPSAQNIVEEPRLWLEGRDSIAAGIIHRNGSGEHEVEVGLFSGERALLDAWVEERLRPMLRRTPELRRAENEHNKPILLPKPPSTAEPSVLSAAERRAAAARREALVACLDGRPLNIDIMWQHPDTRRSLLATIAALLGFPARVDEHYGDQEWQFGGLRVRIRTSELGFLGSSLALPSRPGLSARAALGEAIRARRLAVAERLDGIRDGVGLTFVEINERKFFMKAATDPKFALRLGLADTGRLSKFFVASGQSPDLSPDRVRWTVLDGLRQLGAVTVPTLRTRQSVPEDLQYLALWVVRKRADGPTRMAGERLVAVLMHPGDETHPVRGWNDDSKAWVPYSDLLLTLATRVETAEVLERNNPAESWEASNDIERQIRSILYQVRGRPTLLLANAVNLRRSWPWLQNGTLEVDQLGFGPDDVQQLATYGPDLRFVLIRDDGGRDEVPQWYAPTSDDSAAGLASGLWAEVDVPEDNRIFASITERPHTSGKGPKGTMKLGPHPAWRTGPSKKAWNPQYLELTVAGCLSAKALAAAGRDDVTPDKPSTWAALAHQLRVHDDYAPLSRPLPMHLAKLAEDYVLPTEQESQDN